MKDKLIWLFLFLGAAAAVAAILMLVGVFVPAPAPSPSAVPWDEQPKDGWTFVGRTPEGCAIKKKYFSEHGVWIFSTYARNESISAVPVEILQRTQAGDSYKEGKK